MHTKIIIHLLSRLCLFMGMILVLPLGMSLHYGDGAALAFAGAIAVSVALGFLGGLIADKSVLANISVREGIATVFLTWIFSAIIGGLPFYFQGILGPLDAYFESMSGLTTTGATVITDLEILPRSILFWRSLCHWVGGLGIIVLFVALLPQVASSAVYLYNAEVSGFSNSRILPRIRTTAVALFYIYALITIILTGILVMLGMSEYDAINHAFSAIATGGFSTYNSSVTYFDDAAIETVLGFFMIMAGGNFALYYQVTQSGIKVLWQDVEFKAYISMITLLTLLITANICWVNGYTIGDGLRFTFFQVASFGSTTGYVSHDYEQWPSFAKLLLAITYLTGGCAGSTAGGIKICRFVVLLKTVAAELRRALHPQLLLTVVYGKKPLPLPTIMNISRFFFMYLLVIVVLTAVTVAAGMAVEEAIFGIAACLSSVGPAFGSIGATGNYAEVPALGKLAMTMAMVLGRLELFTALALLRSDFWRSKNTW